MLKAGVQAWPVNSQRMMMMGSGMPIAQSKTERMNSPHPLRSEGHYKLNR
jgi:hypothetical protein